MFIGSQTGISKGKILRMGKGFVLDDIEGNDLATLFHQGFQRKVCMYVCDIHAIETDSSGGTRG